MKDKELIPVFVRIENGKTTCICKQGNKKCDRVDCERDMVERDAYRDVEKMTQNAWKKAVNRTLAIDLFPDCYESAKQLILGSCRRIS